MSAAHTPGPWFIQPAGGLKDIRGAFVQWTRYDISAGADDSFHPDYYRVGSVSNANDSPANEANARLIAAAPELLEALIAVSKQARHSDYDWDVSLSREVSAAIAKATGGEA